MNKYDHKKIEKKWQTLWEKKGIYHAKDFQRKSASSQRGSAIKPKFYGLIEFPYPSGDGLHVGHPRPYIGMDVISRKRRMQGYNVLYPIGWDAFGLPTENYAIKTGLDPRVVTKKNTDTFRRQIKSLGVSFDWSREINTTDPKYYKWTQWIFLQFFKKGLAYKAKMNINWCPKDKIGLADEEVINGCCERCGTPVEKREKEQWMLAITKYAERLDKDLDDVDYLPQIKLGQRNWIGRSSGYEIPFHIQNFSQTNADLTRNNADKIQRQSAFSQRNSAVVNVFTTRPDTIFGATFLALAPEVAKRLTGKDFGIKVDTDRENKPARHADASHAGGEKIGIDTGLKAKNPANDELIPIFVVNYVSAEYGTGAIMGVPAHDERDFEFAKKYNLPIKQVITDAELLDKDEIKGFYIGDGILINSTERFDYMDSEKAKEEIIKFVGGKKKTTYKLRDWIFSRQRYWGEPIPLIFCQNCKKSALTNADQTLTDAEKLNPGWIPVPEKNLPVELPKLTGKMKNYQPTDSGESPLANISKWVNTTCPTCGGKAKRETDTMPNWAGSSWYYLRYTDVKNKKVFASMKNLKYWLGVDPVRGREGSQRPSASNGVDWYNGGNEHTTLHLLYSRFWHKFLYDLKLVPTPEPYMKRTSHGMILGEGGVKMSKSLGNVINPNDIVKTYGADTMRIYEMFMGPFDQAVSWSDEAIVGPRRFLERIWKIGQKISSQTKTDYTQKFADKIQNKIHKLIKKVSEDIEAMKFNTAISTLMIFVNENEKLDSISKNEYEIFLKLLSPFAPHITEELYAQINAKKIQRQSASNQRESAGSIHLSQWPTWDAKFIKDDEVTIVVQVNGKVRGQFMASVDINETEATEKARQLPEVKKWIENAQIKKVIFIPRKIVNIVI